MNIKDIFEKEKREDIKKTLNAIEKAPDDLRALAKVSKITKEGFSEGTLDSRCFSVEEQNEFFR